jgi:aryl-alcohol dehydrogenase-like predicted oxidoreductase
MNDLIAQGKVLYWGTSEWSAAEIAEAHAVARGLGLAGPTMEQPQYNLFTRERVEREYHRLYESFGLGTTIWSPLASGILTGKYANGVAKGTRMDLADYKWLRERLESPAGREQVEKTRRLEPLAREAGASVAQLAIAWCLVNPRVSTVILGATSAAQLRENLAALEFVPKLDTKMLERIETVVANRPEPPPRY